MTNKYRIKRFSSAPETRLYVFRGYGRAFVLGDLGGVIGAKSGSNLGIEKIEEGKRYKTAKRWAGVKGGTVGAAANLPAYAAAGAAIGSVVPGAGTAIGAGIGAGIGAVRGALGGALGARQNFKLNAREYYSPDEDYSEKKRRRIRKYSRTRS